ncbi:MAG: T9SS type A sorting domain-containing protein [Bacteroidales bacterium]|nr:T9SS type A sorting domain-containing protein [Bacteroidales bacterium]
MKNIYLTFSLFYCLIFSANSQPVPVAYYPLNGNANDVGINGLNGTTFGNPTPTTNLQGVSNSAYEFDGVDDYINIGSSLLLKPSSQVSLALWAYNSNWTSFTSWAALAGNTASGGYELIIHGSSSTLESQCKRNGTYGITSYALSNLSSGWHHLAFTFDGRYSILYVDGFSVDTDDAGAVYPIQYGNPGNSTIIGDEAGTGSTPEGDSFTGKIDEVRFYDVALTAQEILNLYNSSLTINENFNDKISQTVFPNPSSDIINIELPENHEMFTITLSDVTGKIIDRNSISSRNGLLTYMRPSNVTGGFYLLSIDDQNGNRTIHKILFN